MTDTPHTDPIDPTSTNPGQHRAPVEARDIKEAEARAADLAARATVLRDEAARVRRQARTMELEAARKTLKAVRQPRIPGHARTVHKALLILPDLMVRCADYCAATGNSFNGLVEQALIHYMDTHPAGDRRQ